ncbi:MAG: ATP-binding cassette domain-containing protein, partial [Firmicutes bacterium]|nr:ATP-binding cassette domain-containing protein [Bacillota bacterium]
MSSALLEMRQICMEFPGVKALHNVDLVLNRGEIHAIVGENGAGKSTLIKILAGVHRPSSGTILLDGQKVHITAPHDALARGIGVVYQDRALVPFLTAEENMLLGREPTRFGVLDRAAIKARATDTLNMMGLSVPLDKPVSDMRAGDQQLVEIAKIVMLEPRIMVLDEPTAPLSRHEVEALFSLLGRFRDRGIGIIYISHHLDEIFQIADTVTILRNGEVAATGPTSSFTKETMIRHMIDRDLKQQYVKETVEIGEEVLRVDNLTSSEAGITDVSISVR